MTAIFKAFAITTAFALTIGLTAATVSAPAMADGVAACSATPTETC